MFIRLKEGKEHEIVTVQPIKSHDETNFKFREGVKKKKEEGLTPIEVAHQWKSGEKPSWQILP